MFSYSGGFFYSTEKYELARQLPKKVVYLIINDLFQTRMFVPLPFIGEF